MPVHLCWPQGCLGHPSPQTLHLLPFSGLPQGVASPGPLKLRALCEAPPPYSPPYIELLCLCVWSPARLTPVQLVFVSPPGSDFGSSPDLSG